MSKAFTKEDDLVLAEPARRRGVPIPVGVPNYITDAGARALRAELDGLPADQHDRARELSEHLATAIVMLPPADRKRVGFGATVTVADEDGEQTSYRIVGAIESEPREYAIYWQSPVALALHDAAVGDMVGLPRGDVEVIAIEY
jgi:transcription elongation GreA/GreB family factor